MKKVIISILIVLLAAGGLLWAAAHFQEKLIFFPEKLDRTHQFTIRGGWQEMWFEPEKGVELNALFFSAGKSNHELVIYFHGNAGSLDSWGSIAHDFTSHGWNVLMVDYRGYGKSTGTITSEADLHRDADFIYREMGKEYKEKDICVYGRSLGSGIAAKVAANYNPGVTILETPYYSLPDVAASHYPFLPVKKMLRYEFPTWKWISEIKGPVYLVHGTADKVIPYNSSERLVKLSPRAHLTTVPNGTHNDLSESKEYQSLLLQVLHH